MSSELPIQFVRLLESDDQLTKFWNGGVNSEDPDLKLIRHFQKYKAVLTSNDLLQIILQSPGGSMSQGDGVAAQEYLEKLLHKTGYRPVTFSTGLELNKAIEETSWICKPYFPRGHITMLASSPGIGKTYVALDVVKRITNPEATWFDGEPLEIPEESSRKIIWCECEGFQGGIKERLKTFSIDPESVIFPFEDPLRDFRLDQSEDREQLAKVIQYHEPVAIFVDSLRGSHRKEEKSSKRDARGYVLSHIVG